MSVDRATQHAQRAQARELAETEWNAQVDNDRDLAKEHHHHQKHRGHYGGCHYRASQQARLQRQQRRLPLSRRPPPRPKQRRRALMDEDMIEDLIQNDERELFDDNDLFDQFKHLATYDSANRDQDSGREADPRGSGEGRAQMFRLNVGGPPGKDDQPSPPPLELKAKLGPRREQPDVGERLMGMRVPGASTLFGLVAKGNGPGSLAETLGSLEQVVLSAARSGTGFASNAPSLTRVAMMGSLAVLTGQPASSVSSFGIGDARTLSIATVAATWGDQRLPANAPESAGNTVALLPLLALNTQRPRTPGARQGAIDRLSMALKTGI